MSAIDVSNSATSSKSILSDKSPADVGLDGLSIGIGVIIGVFSTLFIVGIVVLLVWLIRFKRPWKKKEQLATTAEPLSNPPSVDQGGKSTEVAGTVEKSQDSKPVSSSSAPKIVIVSVPRNSIGGIIAQGPGTQRGGLQKPKPKKSVPSANKKVMPISNAAKNRKKTFGGSEFIREEPSNVWNAGFEKGNIVPPAAPTPPTPATPTKKKEDKKVDVQFSSSEDSVIGEEGRTAQPKKNAMRGYMTLRQREIEKLESKTNAKKGNPSPKSEKSAKTGDKSKAQPEKSAHPVKPEKEEDTKSKAGGKSEDGAEKNGKSAESGDKGKEL